MGGSPGEAAVVRSVTTGILLGGVGPQALSWRVSDRSQADAAIGEAGDVPTECSSPCARDSVPSPVSTRICMSAPHYMIATFI